MNVCFFQRVSLSLPFKQNHFTTSVVRNIRESTERQFCERRTLRSCFSSLFVLASLLRYSTPWLGSVAVIGKTPEGPISSVHVHVEFMTDAVEAKACASAELSHGPEPAGGRSANSDVIAVTVTPLSLMKKDKKYALSMTTPKRRNPRPWFCTMASNASVVAM